MGRCHDAKYRQDVLLRYIVWFVGRYHYPPTMEEMRSGLRWSTKSLVDYHLRVLEDEGKIERERNDAGVALPRGLNVVTSQVRV